MGKKEGDFPHGIYEAQSFMFNTSVGVFSLQQKEFMKHNYSKDSVTCVFHSKRLKTHLDFQN